MQRFTFPYFCCLIEILMKRDSSLMLPIWNELLLDQWLCCCVTVAARTRISWPIESCWSVAAAPPTLSENLTFRHRERVVSPWVRWPCSLSPGSLSTGKQCLHIACGTIWDTFISIMAEVRRPTSFWDLASDVRFCAGHSYLCQYCSGGLTGHQNRW